MSDSTLEVAKIAHGLGWTMNQVREHSWNDLQAMNKVIEDKARKARMKQSAKRAG